LSANPPAIPAIKEAVREVDSVAAASLVPEMLRLASADEVRALLAGYGRPVAMSEEATP
jgi:phosphoenolpyruvate-protein kinase (PTS system EI component)